MKICVFSDSHGSCDYMLDTIKSCRPDMVVHLGDGRRDLEKIRSRFPDLPLVAVRGNCDLASDLPDVDFLYINGLKILLTHGHLYNVKHGLSALLEAACAAEVDIILYGHTHRARHERFGDLHILNPGSCGLGASQSCALLEISDRGEVSVKFL